MEIEVITNTHNHIAEKICKDIFITKYIEINMKNYMSLHIHFRTICPTPGSISSKYIIQLFFCLIIIQALYIMKLIIDDIGVKMFLQK